MRITDPAEAQLFNLLDQENVAGDNAALTSLSGAGLAAMPSVVMNSFNALADAIAVRQEVTVLGGGAAQSGLTPNIVFAYAGGGLSLDATSGEIAADVSSPRDTPPTPWLPPQNSGFNTWGEAIGNWSSVGSHNGNPGFSSNVGGFIIGADRDLGNLLTGGAFGYARSTAAASALTGSSNTYAGSGYVTYMPGAFVFDLRAVLGPTSADTSRSIMFPGFATNASGSVNGWGWLAEGDAGYRFTVARVNIEPYLGLTGQTIYQGAFTETSADGLELPSQSFARATSALGSWFSATFNVDGFTLMPLGRLAWAHDFLNDTLATQAAFLNTPLTIAAADPGRDAALINATLAGWQTQRLRVFLSYNGEFRSNATSNGVSAGLIYNW
jgi:subtilase-type serine protease